MSLEIIIVLLVISSIQYTIPLLWHAPTYPHNYTKVLYCITSLSRSLHIYLYTLLYLTFFLTSFFTFSFLLHARIITTICSIEKCGVFGSWFIIYINANNFLYIFFVFSGWHWSSLTYCTICKHFTADIRPGTYIEIGSLWASFIYSIISFLQRK